MPLVPDLTPIPSVPAIRQPVPHRMQRYTDRHPYSAHHHINLYHPDRSLMIVIPSIIQPIGLPLSHLLLPSDKSSHVSHAENGNSNVMG